jgi:hypothetical protein
LGIVLAGLIAKGTWRMIAVRANPSRRTTALPGTAEMLMDSLKKDNPYVAAMQTKNTIIADLTNEFI